jgi:hypothetical protein
MSLINEALKRASVNQAKPPEPAPGLTMLPAEQAPPRRRRWTLIAVGAAGVLGLGEFFVVWSLQKPPAQAARSPAMARIAPGVKTNHAPVAAAGRLSAGVAKPAPAAIPKPAASPAPLPAPAPDAAVPARVSAAPARTNPPAPVPAPVLPPAMASPSPAPNAGGLERERKAAPAGGQVPTLKLQAIFYRPANPSVMINGSTYFSGEEFKGLKVLAIEPQRVTVQWNGQTRVLTLR